MLALVQVDSEFRQAVHEVNVEGLFGQKFGDFTEKLVKGPHLLRVHLQQTGQDGREMLLHT